MTVLVVVCAAVIAAVAWDLRRRDQAAATGQPRPRSLP